ncbi:hypothetical protein N8609_00905 [Verrucomicrobia bacterium]|nr:hypothetical protein [Verrucomicrobiota bacterium]
MNNILKTMTFVVALAAISLSSSIDVSAQGRGERGERGGRGGGRGNFDFSEMRARIMDSIKDRFGFSDAEFKAIQPLIEDIQEKQREARTGGRSFAGFGGFGGRSGRGGDRDAGNPEMSALQKAIESGNNIEAKLSAFRKARAKKEAVLKKSQETLKSVLTIKQEAVAVTIGLIP